MADRRRLLSPLRPLPPIGSSRRRSDGLCAACADRRASLLHDSLLHSACLAMVCGLREPLCGCRMDGMSTRSADCPV